MYVRTREVVEQLLRYGFSQAEIVAGTGRSKSTIAYHNAGSGSLRTTASTGATTGARSSGSTTRATRGLKADRCEICGISEWLGRPLSLPLHHLNGDGDDNRLENLQLLCPNCHSQTENFAGRKRRRVNGVQSPFHPREGALVSRVVEAPPALPHGAGDRAPPVGTAWAARDGRRGRK